MGQLLRRLAAFLGLISPKRYAYPALDITLPGDRRLHLVGSIHMGTVDMSPLPSWLAARLQQADALIVEADITDSASPSTTPSCSRRWNSACPPKNINGCWRCAMSWAPIQRPSSPCPAGRSR